jgi:putative transposase
LAVVDNVETNLLFLQKQNPEKIDELRIPSQASIYRYISKLEAYDLTASRLGKPEAERRFRRVFGKQKTNRVLERWEIDHTPLDLLIVCEKTLLPLGRPWLTMAIDKFSRMPVGFYLSFRTPSAYAVLQCIKQAIQPKDSLLTPYPDITLPWPARGIPEVIVCDNGMDLHANAFISVCQELGIQVQFCPAKKPEYKGAIERFFRTINHGLIHKIPGTVFSSPKERGDYQSEKKACITLDVLLHLITKWIAEIYSHTHHRGIGMTPFQKWEIGVAQRIIEHPVEPSQLDVIVGESSNRRVFHYGIEMNGLHYNNHELQFLRRRYGEDLRVDLKYYEDDMGYIYVFDPGEKSYFKVEAIDQEYASNLRLVQHKAIRRVILALKKDPNNRQLLLQKKNELQEIVSQAMFSHKMAKRKLSAVYKGKDNLAYLENDLFIDNQNLIDETKNLSDDLPTYDINLRGDLDKNTGEAQ